MFQTDEWRPLKELTQRRTPMQQKKARSFMFRRRASNRCTGRFKIPPQWVFFLSLDSLCVRCACSIIFLLPDRRINWFDLIDQWIVLFREFVFLLFCRNWSDGAYVLALLRNALCAAKFAVLLFRQFIQHLNKLSSCSYVKRAQKKLQNHCLPQNDQIHD